MKRKIKQESIFPFLICMTLTCISAYPKVQSGVVVTEEDGSPVEGAYITLFPEGSTVITCTTGPDGGFAFEISDTIEADASLTVTALGFRDQEKMIPADSIGSFLRIPLAEAFVSVDLAEVTVTADRSTTVKRTANGEIFHLSARAMKESNPFLALAEIPVLMSDYTTSTVRMLDGRQPLILIDGNPVNSGISPILPSQIESVEVITTVPARYLQEGYSGIVNIRLKRNRTPYIWFGGNLFQSVPPCDNSGPGLNLEVGNEKLSVYGSGLYNYSRNTTSIADVVRSNTGYRQEYSSVTEGDSNQLYGWLLLKYTPTPKDYLAASVRYDNRHRKSSSYADGDFVTDITEDYHADGKGHTRNSTMSTDLYYRHSFGAFCDIELNLNLNTDANRTDDRSIETIGARASEYHVGFHNGRTSGYLRADYSRSWNNGNSLSAGNHLSVTEDRIDQTTSTLPVFISRKVSEYIYASFGGRADRLRYSLSGGLESIWIHSGGEDSHYLRPRVSASGTLLFDSANSAALSYTLTNSAPSTALLNPRNTSTDPLLVSTGNPDLKPRSDHRLRLSYTLARNGWYVSPQITARISRDLITQWGFSEEGVYHSSYRNAGKYSEMSYMLNLSFNRRWLSLTAVNGMASHHFSGLATKWSYQAYLSLFARAGKFYFIADMQYLTRSYSEISVTRNRNPFNSRLHVSYNFTPDFYVALGIRNFTGDIRSIEEVTQGTYRSTVSGINRGDGRGFTPYVSVYYSFRKNSQRKIGFENPNFDQLEGLTLKKP